MSDGELQPGQVWEAIQTMSFYKLDNIGMYIDVNGYQCDGRTSSVMHVEPLQERFESFGCQVARVNGHDISALMETVSLPRDGRPLVVLCDTNPWQGIEPLKKRDPKYHYIRFSSAERKQFESILAKMEEGQ